MKRATFITEVYLDGRSQGYYSVPESFCRFDADTGDAHFYSEQPEDWPADVDFEPGIPDDFIYLDHDHDDAYRVLALMIALDEWDLADSAVVYDRNCTVDVGRRSWIVATDSEADDLWDQALENYLDECVLPEVPESAKNYFDRERWKDDAKIDGRWHILARYDGNEYEAETDNGTYYVYRQN